MTYKDALFFTAKCLTLRSYPENIPDVRQKHRKVN